MAMEAIVADLALAAYLPGPMYLGCWCTYPTIWDFSEAWWGRSDSAHLDWKPLTGGTWGKVGRRGIGFHMRGDSEPLLVFRKGKPPRGEQCSNLWPTDAPYWPERRTAHHSEKPAAVLADLLRVTTKPGDVVLDLYAGASASMARVCHLMGRSYIGAESDPERADSARGMLEAIV